MQDKTDLIRLQIMHIILHQSRRKHLIKKIHIGKTFSMIDNRIIAVCIG